MVVYLPNTNLDKYKTNMLANMNWREAFPVHAHLDSQAVIINSGVFLPSPLNSWDYNLVRMGKMAS
jgi:hypothetical protein